MILNKLQNAPEKAIPFAMTLLVAGLACIVLAISWPMLAPSTLRLSTGGNDFLHGFFYGLGFTLAVGGVILAAAATRKRKTL